MHYVKTIPKDGVYAHNEIGLSCKYSLCDTNLMQK